MPFDDKTYRPDPAETKADPAFTLASLIAWLRTKPAEEAYCYEKSGECLWARYIIDHGISQKPSVGPAYWRARDAKDRFKDRLLPGAGHFDDDDGWGNKLAVDYPRTFGAALERALELDAAGVR